MIIVNMSNPTIAGTSTQEVQTSSPSRPQGKSRSSALVVAAGILLSRISGLIRDRVFAHYLGNSEAAGAFKAALRIPNFLQNLFGEGVLSASFIPVYSNLLAQGDAETAGRVAGVVASLLSAAVSILVCLGVAMTPSFVDLVAPGFEGELRLLTVQLVRILFPGVGLLVISAWCLGVLNSHRKFFLSYVAPVFWNLAMITALIWKGREAAQDSLAITLAWGAVAGSLLQLGIQLPFVFRSARGLRFGFNTALTPVREVFRNLGPVVLSRGVVQLSAYIDGMIASFLGASAVSSLAYAQTIYLLPVSLFGMSVAAAELPEMSSSTGSDEKRNARLRQRITSGRRNIGFFVIPSAVAFLLLGKWVVSALYQTGRFGTGDTLYVWYILIGSVIGLLAATWGRLYSSAFYALQDTRTPLRFALVRVVLTGVLGYLFAFPLRWFWVWLFVHIPGLSLPELPGIDAGLGAVGLTSSAGIAGWIEFLLLERALSRRIGPTPVPVDFQIKVWASALLGALSSLAFNHYYESGGFGAIRLAGYDLRPLIILAIFGAGFLVLAHFFKIEEARRFTRRIAR
jgi:putative peptidoglycan lipid II flippase